MLPSPTPSGWRNCTRCTRWRPITDFNYVVHRRGVYGERIYVRHECCRCERKRHTQKARERRTPAEYVRKREVEERRRRRAGTKPRAFTGYTDRKEQRLAAQRNKRRREGTPIRPIGARNKGKYGRPLRQPERLLPLAPILPLIEAKEWTLGQLAKQAGAHEKAVQRWFQMGEADINDVDRLCIALGTTLAIEYPEH